MSTKTMSGLSALTNQLTEVAEQAVEPGLKLGRHAEILRAGVT